MCSLQYITAELLYSIMNFYVFLIHNSLTSRLLWRVESVNKKLFVNMKLTYRIVK